MPVLFNVMEAFFIFRQPHIYFELIEEENYLLSYYDFLDYITSNSFKHNKKYVTEYFEKDIVYNFEVGADKEEITFESKNGGNHILTGISIVRREEEVTVMLVTGNSNYQLIAAEKMDLSKTAPEKVELLKEFNEKLEENNVEPIFIDSENKFAKNLIICRIDLETETIDVRYIAEEYTSNFYLHTDDPDGFIKKDGNYINEESESVHRGSVETISGHGSLFEIAQTCLFLPYYLTKFEDSLLQENHDTPLNKEKASPLKRRKAKNIFGKSLISKPLYILNRHNKFTPDKIILNDALFKIQTSGYWKKLEFDKVGTDKKGNSIHGKTWVNKKLSWFEADNSSIIAKKEINPYTGKRAGQIYIMRNPTLSKNIFKIGYTRKSSAERAKQLSNTSIPDKHYVAQQWHVKDCVKAEQLIHEELSIFRIDSRREYFEIEYDKAIETILNICTKVNSYEA